METPKRKLSFGDSTDDEQLAEEIEKDIKDAEQAQWAFGDRKDANRDRKSYIREKDKELLKKG